MPCLSARSLGLALALAVSAIAGTAHASGPQDVAFSQSPEVTYEPDQVRVSFAIDASADVEVSVLAPDGSAVRHLAAGVIGGAQAPPEPLVDGLQQTLVWNGVDDDGETLDDLPAYAIRVRVNMGVAVAGIAGGDPYAFFSQSMGQGDHAAWQVRGLEAKSDGSVYLIGNLAYYGPAAIRRYDAQGEFLATVFPPPAGLALRDVLGWGMNVRADGSYAPRYKTVQSPALSSTFLTGDRGALASLRPSPEPDRLRIVAGNAQRRSNLSLSMGTDGSLPTMVTEPISNVPWPDDELFGPMFVAYTPDGSAMYLSGVFAGQAGSFLQSVDTEGYWRDGQVWRIDLATGDTSVFFAMPAGEVIGALDARLAAGIGTTQYAPYAAFHGVAVDAAGNVFVGDRQNQRIVVLDDAGNLLREIPVANPDAIAVVGASPTVYVTSRIGHPSDAGELALHRIDDWTLAAGVSESVALGEVRPYSPPSFMTAVEDGGETFVWVAYTTLPARVYRDGNDGFELVKDFYEAGPQRALDLQHMAVDPQTERVFVADGFSRCFFVRDWATPNFEPCMADAEAPVEGISLAIDPNNRTLLTHHHGGPIRRWSLDGEFFAPLPVTGRDNALTEDLTNDWRIGLGMSDRGFAVARDGSLATLQSAIPNDYSGPLRYYAADDNAAPWSGVPFEHWGSPRAAGVRFDRHGNLYVGKVGDPIAAPEGFGDDAVYGSSVGRIYKYAPTGSLAEGSLFPTAPVDYDQVFEVNYGAISPQFARTPRFGVDAFGRIYYPSALEARVGVIDGRGASVAEFGVYANRDSLGGLPGDGVPVVGVPLAYPNSVDATDDYVYVSDIVNARILRLAKTFVLDVTVGGREGETDGVADDAGAPDDSGGGVSGQTGATSDTGGEGGTRGDGGESDSGGPGCGCAAGPEGPRGLPWLWLVFPFIRRRSFEPKPQQGVCQ